MIEAVDFDGFVYNFHCTPDEVYFANGVLVHNCYARYNAVTRWKRVSAEDWQTCKVDKKKVNKKF